MSQSVDIIIPVYNNAHLTICCVHSVYKHLSKHLNSMIIHDDCSSQETNSELRKLAGIYSNLKVIRSEQNIGFAAGVNKACAAATAPYLFILNSDTEIKADIINPMLQIMSHDPDIAAINPSGPVYSPKKLKRCIKLHCPKSGLTYTQSTNASGYALLMTRELFHQVGGFNTVYGRGYYEDTELSRVLIEQNYRLAIFDTTAIDHVGQSSFNTLNKANKTKNFAKDLIQKNKEIYLQRNPKAAEQFEVFTLKSNFKSLPEEIQEKMVEVAKNGGKVIIHGLFTPKNLPFYQINFKKISIANFFSFIKFRSIKDQTTTCC